MRKLYKDIEPEILVTRDQLQHRIRELGEQITRDFAGKGEILAICILKGSVVFFTDLIREIDLPMVLDFMQLSSYGKSTTTSGIIHVNKDLEYSPEGKQVLVVEDIVDSGLTMQFLDEYLREKGARDVSIISLMDKPTAHKVPVNVKYVGFEIPDAFVVGYGLDYDQRYRNLPEIGILRPEIYSK